MGQIMTKYGYVRVSSDTQNADRQIKKMCELGVGDKCLYIDHASGKDMNRPAWIELQMQIKQGDTIYIDSLDRLGRTYDLVTSEWRRLTRERGVDIKMLDIEMFDSAKFREMGEIGAVMEDMLLSLLSYVADTERKKIKARQAEGIAIAKAKGVYRGSKKIKPHKNKREQAQIAIFQGNKPKAAEILGVSVATIYNMIADGRLKG